jgi:hypothetical protein
MAHDHGHGHPHPRPSNAIGDLVISDNRLGVGTSDTLSTLTVRAAAPYSLTGTVDKELSTTLAGTGTLFLSELNIGDRINVLGGTVGSDEQRTVVAIASDVSLTVDSAFTYVLPAATAQALPSAIRVDDQTGTPQFFVSDHGTVGIGTTTPNAALHIAGLGQGDLFGCPVGIRVHSPLASDAWPLVMSNEADGGDVSGIALWATQFSGDGGATLVFGTFDQGQINLNLLSIDGNGLHLNQAGFTATQVHVIANYQVALNDHYVYADAGSAGVTITLPGCQGQEVYIFKAGGTGPVTIVPSGAGVTIDGATSRTISNSFDGVKLIMYGNMWFAAAQPAAPSDISVAGDYAVAATDRYIFIDAGSSGHTVTLPAASGHPIHVFKSAGTGDVTIVPTGSGVTINGASSKAISNIFDGMRLILSGNTWFATAQPAA